MKKDDDYIEKLFSEKFEKFEVQTSVDDWNKLNSRLKKSNFLKFSFATFNIFYLCLFFSFAVTATYFGVNNIKMSKKVKQLENTIRDFEEINNQQSVLIVDSMADNDSVTQIIKEHKVEEKHVVQGCAEKKADLTALKNKEIIVGTTINQTPIAKDSVIVNSDSISKPPIEPPKIKKVKKTIVVKPTNVIVKDTVIVKKPSK